MKTEREYFEIRKKQQRKAGYEFFETFEEYQKYNAEWANNMRKTQEQARKEAGLPKGCGALLHPTFCGCSLEQQ